MPITYEIDKGKIRTKCFGDIELGEVIEHFRTLELDPNCPDELDVFLDLREMTSLPEAEELREVSREIARVRPSVRFGACAIVAPGDTLFGMLRMFEVFVEDYFRTTQVFRSAEDTDAWLTRASGPRP